MAVISSDLALFGYSRVPLVSGLIATFGFSNFTGNEGDIISDHVARAQALLVEQFKTSDRLKNLLGVFVDEAQNIEFVLNDLKNLKNLANQTGDQLDLIGELVGEPREYRDDDEYREAIYFKILINRSNGEPESVIAALRFFTDAEEIKYTESYPAKIKLYFVSDIVPPINLKDRLQQLAPAGVDLQLFWLNVGPIFGYGEENGIEPDANVKGWNESALGYEEQGGRFMERL